MGQYTYQIASQIPGGVWMPPENTAMSDHLTSLIRENISSLETDAPDNQLFTIGSQNINGIDVLIVETVTDLTTDELTILNGLVPRSADYFIVTTDDGITDLGEPAHITQEAGPLSSTTITLQWKTGAGQDHNGWSDTVLIVPEALMPINKTSEVFNGVGKVSFVIGASLSRGNVAIKLIQDNLLTRTMIAHWS